MMEWAKLTLETVRKIGADGWTAIFTGALVLTSVVQSFFILLANRVANKAANAAKESADATQIIERAYVVEGVAERTNVFGALFELASRWPQSPPMGEQPNVKVDVKVWFTNYGKTPASMRSWGTCLSLGGEIPSAALEPKFFEVRTLAPGETTSDNLPPAMNMFQHSWEQSRKLNEGSLQLWLSGFVEFEDIFGRGTKRTFTWRYDRPMRRFVPFQSCFLKEK